jgi:hypothetical protein
MISIQTNINNMIPKNILPHLQPTEWRKIAQKFEAIVGKKSVVQRRE